VEIPEARSGAGRGGLLTAGVAGQAAGDRQGARWQSRVGDYWVDRGMRKSQSVFVSLVSERA